MSTDSRKCAAVTIKTLEPQLTHAQEKREERVFDGRRIGISLCPRLFLHLLCAPLALLHSFSFAPPDALVALLGSSIHLLAMSSNRNPEFSARLLHSAASVLTHPHSMRPSSSRALPATMSCRTVGQLPRSRLKIFVDLSFVTLPAPLPVAIIADGPWLIQEPLCLGVETPRLSFSTLATPHRNALLAPACFVWLLPLTYCKFVGVAARITRAARSAPGTLQANPSFQNQMPLRGCEGGRWLHLAALTARPCSRIAFALCAD